MLQAKLTQAYDAARCYARDLYEIPQFLTLFRKIEVTYIERNHLKSTPR